MNLHTIKNLPLFSKPARNASVYLETTLSNKHIELTWKLGNLIGVAND